MNRLRIDQITFTRFIAAISIVIYHFGKDIFPFNNEHISFIFKQANVGVSYFFFLSGFVLVIAYSKKSKLSTFEFFKNRFARIYPVYFLAIIFIILFKAINNFYNFDVKGMILNVFMIQSWIPGKALSFNGPAWSLAVEVLFYALFPFLFNRFYNRKKISKSFVLIVISIWVLSQIILQWYTHLIIFENLEKTKKMHEFFHFFPLMHLNEFLLGNLSGFFFIKTFITRKRDFDKLILLVLILLLLFLNYNGILNYHNGLLLIFFIPLVLLLSLNTGRITSIFNYPILIFLGEISYGIYILQLPIHSFTIKIFKYLNIDNPTLLFYFYILFLLIVSSISFKLFEQPLRKKIKNFDWRSIFSKV